MKTVRENSFAQESFLEFPLGFRNPSDPNSIQWTPYTLLSVVQRSPHDTYSILTACSVVRRYLPP